VADGKDSSGASQSGSTTLQLKVELPRNSRPKIVLALLLLAFNAALFICWRQVYVRAQDALTRDWPVPWEQPAGLLLDPGPITFWYDATHQVLHHRGPIDKALKVDLIRLARLSKTAGDTNAVVAGASSDPKKDDTKAGPVLEDPRLLNYAAAISRLTFDSNSLIDAYFLYLLSIAGLSGMIGTQIRAFANFIYLSTQTDKLDVGVWWPWYLLRPALGFLLGLTVVLLVQAKIFVPTTDGPPSGTAWWMALAMLVGFGADDFAQRLRLVAQAIFGKDK
jgi:hypothetical protein